MPMDVVDYEIKGAEMQFVEIELDPGEAAVGEAGSMMFMEAGIAMDTIFGDGSQQNSGLWGALVGAGKRLITGANLFTTVYTNQSPQKRRVAFAAPVPGKILPIDLRSTGGTLVAQKQAFLCAARGVSIGLQFQQRLSVGFFGGDGFVMQRLDGDGMAFVHGGGTVERRDLQPGETLLVEAGCLVAYTQSVNFEIQFVGGVKTALFGGEGLFLARVTGPGTVWIQSMPFSRLASRVFAAAPQNGGSSDRASGGASGASSVLGAAAGGLLGGLLGNDD
ncbi:MAG TPA: AIM24 family protein [Burkholderiaceae bacterium]